MGGLAEDVRFAIRQLRRNPAFTAIAVIALGLGTGASVALFCVIDGVYLHGLPYTDADRVVMVWEDQSARGGTVRSPAAPENFLEWRDRATSFAALAALRNESRRLTGLEQPVVPLTHLVTPNYFELLGVQPLLGRSFAARDGVERDTVMISHGLWQGPLGGDPDILGKPLELGGQPFTVIGIVPPDFYSHHVFPTQPDLWLAGDFEDERGAGGARQLVVFGRLAPGRSVGAAQRELDVLAEQLAQEHPQRNAGWGVLIEPVRTSIVGGLRQTFVLLLGAVGLVLLIACANVANLFLARVTQRRREVALRTALGASAGRIRRQLLAEGLLLSLLGSGAGVLLALLLVPTLSSLIPQGAGVPFVEHVRVDVRVLFLGLALALATGLLFGLLPARQAARTGIGPVLRDGARGSSGSGPRSARQGGLLIAAEVALAVVVVIAAALMAQSFVALRAFDPGFATDQRFTLRTSLGDGSPGLTLRPAQHFAELEQRLGTLPGVESVGSISFPLPFNPRFVVRFASPAIAEEPGDEPRAILRVVTPGYFATLGTRSHGGRFFDGRDRAETAPVAIVDQALVRRYFATDPLGRTVALGSDVAPALGPGVERQIVGVVGEVLSAGADPEPHPTIYLVHAQAPLPIMNVVLHTNVDPLSVAPQAERVAWSMGGDVNVYGIETLEQAVADSQWRTSFSTLLLGGFALLALLLGAAGIFAVVSHSVAQRTGEIGVRMSLGARTVDVLGLVFSVGLRPTLLGVALGSVAALLVTRLLRGLLYSVTASDPKTYIAVGGVLAATAVAASLLPALRAARVDPIRALRAE